jgi:hypothetical protein
MARRVAYCLLACACIFGVFGATGRSARAQAPDPAQQAELLRLNAEAAQLRSVEQSIRTRDFAGADRKLREFTPHTRYGSLHAAFLRGVILETSGRSAEARDIYRSLLVQEPSLARVRLQLAGVLATLNDDAAAKHNLDLLASEMSEPDVADRLRTISRALDNKKRWYVQSYFSIAPSTNVNSGPSSPQVLIGNIPFTLSPGTAKRSGLGAVYGLDAGANLPISEWASVIAAASFSNSDFSGAAYDDRNLRVSIGPQFHFGDVYFGFEPFATRRWYAEEGYGYSLGGKVYSRFLPFAGARVESFLSVAKQKYDTYTFQDGWHTTVGASLDTFMTPSSFWRFGASLDHETTTLRHLNYNEEAVSAGYFVELPSGISLFPTAQIARRDYVGDFPFTNKPRRDKRVSAVMTLTKRDLIFLGFAPRFSYGFTSVRSNVSIYSYTRHDFSIKLVKDF